MRTVTYQLAALSAALIESPLASARRTEWLGLLDDHYQDGHTTLGGLWLALTFLVHALWELRRWPALSEAHRWGLINLAVRLGYAAVLIAWLYVALTDLLRAHPQTALGLVLAASPTPLVFSSWPADLPLLREVRIAKRRHLTLFKAALVAAVVLILIGSWATKVALVTGLGYLARELWGAQIREWWEGLRSR